MDPPYPHKRHRHNHHHHQHHQQPPPTAIEPVLRILCPSGKAGGVIGKGGAVIRQLREDTGARIRIIEDFSSHSDERVIIISANPNPNHNPSDSEGDFTIVQGALIKVFERILKVDEERGEISNSNGNGNGSSDNGGEGHDGNLSNSNSNVMCKMLIGNHQADSLLGNRGKVLEKITNDSSAQIRVLGRDSLPGCSSPGDELIQISGNFQAVKKALLMVSSCLHEHSRSETFQGANMTGQPDTFPHRGSHGYDHHSRGFFTSSAPENFGPNHRMIPEEDVVFKLLCPVERTGNLIGKGGFIVRGIQNETGASIKINESIVADDERVVIISSRESVDLRRSPAQDAVIRVHSRIAEIGFEPGAAVVARLLVPSPQIGCVIGKGGFIVNEMRRSTGANIRIFGRDQGPRINSLNDELVQISGNIQSVENALFQITSRILEHIFPPRHNSSYLNTFQELPSPSFRHTHDQVSPGHYHSPIGPNHGYDNRSFSQGPNHPSNSYGTEGFGGGYSEQERHHYSGDRAHLPPYVAERPPSPNSWYPQAVNSGHPGRFSDSGPGHSGVGTSNSQSGQMQMTSVEIVVPHTLLPHVYGENGTNLGHLTQFSGADVTIHDPNPGATEGLVVLSGTPAQLHTAQSLVHAFIFCGQEYN